MIDYASNHESLNGYLPEQRETKRLPRQWIINLVYTRVGNEFASWTRERIAHRHEKVV